MGDGAGGGHPIHAGEGDPFDVADDGNAGHLNRISHAFRDDDRALWARSAELRS
jgi:hypothetical protein